MDENIVEMVTDYSVSIVITTKNRCSELVKCIESCMRLQSIDEILVFDDGSSDDTYEYVKFNYPTITLFRSEKSLGLIGARTKCAYLAKGDIIISIDDDCIFADPLTVDEIVKFFNYKQVAVVTIPVVDVLKSEKITQEGKGSLEDLYICPEFRGCAHAIRKDVFIKLGGYFNDLIRQEEEKEYSIRLYNNNYIVRLGNCSKPILHYHSIVRNHSQIAYFRARNKILINYIYTPTFFLFFEIIKQIFSVISFEIKNGQIVSCCKGLISARRYIIRNNPVRSPVRISKYFFLKQLRVKGVLRNAN